MAPSPLIQRYERILQADPRSRIFVELSRALLEDGQPERAAEVCERGLEHHRDSVQARVVWGKALLALGRIDDALVRFGEAIAADPANPYAYDLVADALARAGHVDRALPLLQQGAALHPGDGRIRRWMAEAARVAAGASPPASDASPASRASVESAPAPQQAASDAASLPAAVAGATAADGSPPNEAAGVERAADGTPAPPEPQHVSTPDEAPALAEAASGDEWRTWEAAAGGAPRPAPGGAAAGDDGGSGAPSGEARLAPALETEAQAPQHAVDGAAPAQPAIEEGDASLLGPEPPLHVDPFAALAGDAREASAGGPPPDALADRADEADPRGDREVTPPPIPRALADAAEPAPSPLDLIPDGPAAPPVTIAPAPPAPAVGARAAASPESAEDLETRSYEEELRHKLLPPDATRPGFLRRHARAVALAAAALAIAAGVLIYFSVRASHRAEDTRAAVESARTGLARDTLGALREAARVLERAQRGHPDAEASALQAEVTALLAHDFGDARARDTAHELVASGRAGAGALAARWLLATPGEEEAAASALIDGAFEGTPLARALAGEILLARRDRVGARTHLDAAARASPPMLRALCGLADLDLARGDAEAALAQYTRVLRVQATHPRAALGAAEARLRLGRELPEALRTLEAVEADPGSAPPRAERLRMDLAMARLLAGTGRTSDAERRLSAAAAREPGRPEIPQAQADVLARSGDLDGALRAAQAAARLAPHDPGARELVARLQLRRGHYREVLSTTEPAATRVLRLYRGVARLALGQPEAARTELEATRRDGKMTPEAAAWMALAELASGRRAQASAIVGALLATASPHPVALLARGRLDLAEGRADAAERRFREAIEHDPDLIEARCDLARLLMQHGRPQEARTVLEGALARNAYHLDARLELSRARLQTGDAVGAAREAETVLAEGPQDLRAWLALSSARLGTGDPAAALDAAQHARVLSPRSPAAALAAGKAAGALGRTAEARRLLGEAAKLGGSSPEALEARRLLGAKSKQVRPKG